MSTPPSLPNGERADNEVTQSGVSPDIKPTQESLDPFDPARLRMDQNYEERAGVTKLLITVPVHKPKNTWFVRTHPDENYRLTTGVIELKDDNEIYLVDRSLWPELVREPTFGERLLWVATNVQKVLFLWPLHLPGPDGKINSWHGSELKVARSAVDKWVRVYSNRDVAGYDALVAKDALDQPEFPALSMKQILETAFKDRFINSIDHPVLRKLRGEK